MIKYSITLILILFTYSVSKAQTNNYLDVTSFSGTTDEQIAAAIDSAMNSSLNTIYFPNGDYYITKTITVDSADVEINFLGESDENTRLFSAPIIVESGEDLCLGSMFNFDRAGGFERFYASIKNLTLDFSIAIEDSIFVSGGCSSNGHGVHVGNGWQQGQLTLDSLQILHAPGHGIGIENSDPNDIAADSVIMTDIFIYHAGRGGVTTERSTDGGNSHLIIKDVAIQEIGFNNENSAAALDISYDDFNIERVTIITDPTRENLRGSSNNVGIRLRASDLGTASNGSIQDFYIQGSLHAVFFAGKQPLANENITINNFVVEDFSNTGVYVRGSGHNVTNGCSFNTIGERAWYIDPGNSDVESIALDISDKPGLDCPDVDSLGSNYPASFVIDRNVEEPEVCDVTSFPGTTDEQITRAIQCALTAEDRTVYFPNGDYYLEKTILVNQPDIEINFLGESDEGTRLFSAPIINEFSDGRRCFGQIFNFDRPYGFERFYVTVKNFTLDYSLAIKDSIFTSGGCSGSGHGVRVGNGWQNGQLTLDSLRILYAPGYGIGIQNAGTNDIAADSLFMSNIYVYHAGTDGLDTKRATDGGNNHLVIKDMTIHEIGFNDEQSAAALDISYDDFDIEGVTIITDPTRENPQGISGNTGIRLRQRDTTAASNGTIQDLYVKGTNHAIFFAGKTTFNENITIHNFLVEDYSLTGVYVRGRDHNIYNGCSINTVGQRAWYIDPGNSDVGTINLDISSGSGTFCPDIENLGSNYPASLIIETSNEDTEDVVPNDFLLNQNYPNPFNPSTQISYSLPEASMVRLEVINILGQRVATLVDERKSAGSYTVQFNASGLSSGVYFYTIQAGSFTQTNRMLLIK